MNTTQQTLPEDLEQRKAFWHEWRDSVNMASALEFDLFDDSEWYHAKGREVGLTAEKTYHSQAMDWQYRAVNQIIDILHNQGFQFIDIFYPLGENYVPGTVFKALQNTHRSFVVVDPGPKSLDELVLKTNREKVPIDKVYDMIRLTIVAPASNLCNQIEIAILNYVDKYYLFAPLSDSERNLGSRIVPQTTRFGNQHSAKELLDLLASNKQYATNSRFQIGPLSLVEPFAHYDSDHPAVVHPNPPAGTRVFVSIMTPTIFEYISDPSSPAHHSNYDKNRNGKEK